MTTFYKQLSSNEKKSLTHSMRILTNEFLANYNSGGNNFFNLEELLNDLYFYWLRNSAEKNYMWCKESGIDAFSKKFSKEMKTALRTIYFRQSLAIGKVSFSKRF